MTTWIGHQVLILCLSYFITTVANPPVATTVTVFMEKRILSITHDLYAICCSKIWQTFLGVAKSIFLLQTLHYEHDFEFTHLSLLPNGRKDMAIDPLHICSTTT